MKFKVNAKEFYSMTKSLFTIALSIKDGIATIHAEKESLDIYIKTESAKGVLDFTSDELKEMDYHCSNEGKMTVNATMLKKWLLNYRTEDEAIYICKNKKAGWVIKRTEPRSKRPLQLYDSDIEFSLNNTRNGIKLNGNALHEGLKRVKSVIGSKGAYLSFKQNEILLQSTDLDNRVTYIITTGQNLYKDECSVLISSLTIQYIFNYTSGMRKQEITVGIDNKSDLVIWADRSPIVILSCQKVEINAMAYLKNTSDYHFRIDTNLKEWSLINNVAEKDKIPVTVNVDFINGIWEYYIEDYVGNPIEYSLNARYYDPELLLNTPSAYECNPKFLKRMLNLGAKNDTIKMYFASKLTSDHQTVLIEYPLNIAECRMYYIFGARKTELVDMGNGLKVSHIIKKQNDEKEIRIQEWVDNTCDIYKKIICKYSILMDSENEMDHAEAGVMLEKFYLSLPKDIAEDVCKRLEEMSTEA